MKFLQVFIFCLFFISEIDASTLRVMEKISLKKDEQKKILVKYDENKRLFKFRWTLFANGGLVLFKSYDQTVSQNILYLNHKNQSFRVKLKTSGIDFYNAPYMLVKFKEFKYDTNEAIFDMFLSDDEMQISTEYLKND